MTRRVLLAALLSLPLSAFAGTRVEVKFVRPTRIASDREGLACMVQVEPHKENRHLHVGIVPEGETIDGAVHRSYVDLASNNHKTHRFPQNDFWAAIPAGTYKWVAIVENALHERVGYAESPLAVKGLATDYEDPCSDPNDIACR